MRIRPCAAPVIYPSAAMPAAVDATPEHIRDVNARYHDAAAASYDAKWGIDFGAIGQSQVRVKAEKALGGWPALPFERSLEIGSGTGYFSLNLLQQGLMDRATATDISPGMLSALDANASGLGLEVETVVADAEELPFEDQSFDLVFGHAVLHHIPDLARAISEFHRIMRPGGALFFAGEPSAHGDRLATAPKRIAGAIAPTWRRLVGAGALLSHPEGEIEHGMEAEVDVHAFGPATLREALDGAGFSAVEIRGEELVSNMYGWVLRGLEATAEPDQVPRRWRQFAFRSYLALQALDTRLLEPNLPPSLFYNLIASARREG